MTPLTLATILRSLVVATAAVASTPAAQIVDPVVHGVIKDATGAVVPGATVTLTNSATAVTRATVTDDEGRYAFPAVSAGSYEARVVRAGFRPQVRTGVELPVGTVVRLDLTLETVTAAETVEIAAAAPFLATTETAVSRLVRREELDALPVIDRKFNVLATLAPGVTATGAYGGVDIGGSRDFQNGYIVDGLSAEARGAGEQRIRYAPDWIQEFRVLTSQFNAEFGGASGGILNGITRAGSSRTSGRGYVFFRDEAWDATPAFAATKPPLASTRLGATAGGRALRDDMFFFAGFEWLDDEANRIVNTAFPQFNGSVPATTNQTLYLAKLERQAGATNGYRLRYNAERTSSTNVGVGGRATEEQGVSLRYRAHEVAGGWNRILARSMLNELRAAFTRTSEDGRCNFAERNPVGTWFTRIYASATFGCPATGFGLKETSELQVLENLSWTRGAHDFKAGALLSRAGSSGDFRFLRDGQYRFDHDNPFNPDQPSTYPFFFVRFDGETSWSYASWAWGVFVQDHWRLTRDLTLNIGVRYDVDGTYTALNALIPADRGLNTVRRDRDNVAPRAGIVWNVDGRTRLRGGAGIYYDENHANVSTLLLLNSVLVTRGMRISAMTPEAPLFLTGDEVRRFLADALARNTVPEMVGVGATPDLAGDLQVPYSVQSSGGIAREWRWGLSTSADVVYARGLDQYAIRDVNVDREAALAPANARIVRPNPRYADVNRYDNAGSFEYRALQLQATYAPRPAHLVRASYTWARNESNTRTLLEGAPPGFAATNPFDLGEDLGPADHDVRHVLSANWVTALPLGFEFSGLLSSRSALPWSVQLRQLPRSQDPDPFLDRLEPRNSRRGDGYVSLDVRLSKRLRFTARRSATAFIEAFNATNTTNFSGYVNTLGVATFAQPLSASERRRVQIGFRFDF